ncbi:hypothetical protein BO71DRAFT_414906 [Aspergillus ellipticus CBS 707.79]|uniref:Uncharacterized protein n=1 Tax=Aspergillus ellipticus CBS 707.79 TaxID=1448320 RepID=A0A319CRT3_9EURO|nr:hypothetical protein BO71DRAFT_414906 [Aspergillus ellipticus CBS 707.79]
MMPTMVSSPNGDVSYYHPTAQTDIEAAKSNNGIPAANQNQNLPYAHAWGSNIPGTQNDQTALASDTSSPNRRRSKDDKDHCCCLWVVMITISCMFAIQMGHIITSPECSCVVFTQAGNFSATADGGNATVTLPAGAVGPALTASTAHTSVAVAGTVTGTTATTNTDAAAAAAATITVGAEPRHVRDFAYVRTEGEPGRKVESKVEQKGEAKPGSKVEARPEVKPEVKPELSRDKNFANEKDKSDSKNKNNNNHYYYHHHHSFFHWLGDILGL